MEKRAALFLVLSVAILMGYSLLHSWLFPRPEPPPQEKKPAVAAKEPEQPGAEAEVDPQGEGQPNDQASVGPGQEPPTDEEKADEEQAEPAWQPPAQNTLVSLGSLAPDSPYRFLALFDSRGATIRRIELNERDADGQFRYRDLEQRNGYLGNLELTELSDGCQINLVGDGTPASLAKPAGHKGQPGLVAGDEIQAVNGQKVTELARQAAQRIGRPASHVEALQSLLTTFRPGDQIKLQVRRGGKRLTFSVDLTRRPLEVLRPESSNGFDHPQSMLLAVGRWQNDQWELLSTKMHDANWETKIISTDKVPGVEFRFVIDQPLTDGSGEKNGSLEIIKRYLLTPTPNDELQNKAYRSYHISLEVEIRNNGAQQQSVAYQLDGPTGAPSEGWWYQTKVIDSFSAAGARDIVWSSDARPRFLYWGCPKIFRNTLNDEPCELFEPPPGGPHPNRVMRSVGVDTLSFAAILQPAEDESSEDYAYVRGDAIAVAPVSEEDKVRSKKTDTSFRLISETIAVEPDQSIQRRFVLFAGPKQPALLKEYELEPLVYFGWFGVVSRPLVQLLHLFELIPLVNYGFAIIILTVLVRSAMVPISRKAAKNAQMMQVLAPEMKQIAEKYKNDMEKRGKAQQELFRQYNYNPFSGCLLMFLQLPIFIGLYRGLAVDIALRDQPLIPGIAWCSNLAGPDKLFNWTSFMPAFISNEGVGMFNLGPYLNVLPLVTVVLFLIQQKLFTPPPTDEQQALTHKMMSFMTIFIGIMFFKVPSGLCVYFITSSFWGIAERKLLPKPKLPEHLRKRDDKTKSKSPSKPGSNGASRSQKAFLKKKRQKGKK